MTNMSYTNNISNNINRSSGVQMNNNVDVLGKSNISVDDFLKIMAAELSNQNMGDAGGSKTDYISQLAQISTLQYIGEIVKSTDYITFQQEQQFGMSLMGKEVKVLDRDNKELVGVVDKVKFKNGFTMIELDGKEHYVGRVIESGSNLEVNNTEKPEDPEEEVSEDSIRTINNDPYKNTNNTNKTSDIDIKNIPDTRPLTRSEMTEEYFNTKFLEEKDFYDKHFKNLRA